MLHILFLVLKIIGFALLTALGIVILVACLVLFYPIKYDLDIKNTTINAKAHWLFHLLSAYNEFDGKENRWQVRVLWIKLNERKKKQEHHSESELQSEENVISTDLKTDETAKKKKEYTFNEICDKIKQIWDLLTAEKHIRAMKKIVAELVFLVKKILPDKVSGYLEFGFEDPSETGKTLAIISMFYPLLQDKIDIIPNFEEKIFKGEFQAKGYVFASTVLVTAFKIFFDRDVKETYKKIKKMRLK